MKAQIDDVVVASAPDDQLAMIEGNPYFPPGSIDAELFSTSATPYTCPWKGVAQYWDVTTGGQAHHDAAWSYPEPYDGSEARAGHEFAGYVAFDKSQVTLSGD